MLMQIYTLQRRVEKIWCASGTGGEHEKPPRLIFVALIGLLFAGLASIAVRYSLLARRTSQVTWEQLLARLAHIDREKIAAIAFDALGTSGHETFELTAEEIWTMLGGMDGLDHLEKNCQVLIELATYVQRWHPEALVVAEQLRLNAREIEWHIGRLKAQRRQAICRRHSPVMRSEPSRPTI